MSWLVETTLLTKEEIRANFSPDSEEYFTLLAIENKIDELKNSGILDNEDLIIINKVIEGGSYTSLEPSMDMSRPTIAKKFRSACYKISYALGGEFTDEGFLQKLAETYGLTSIQCETIRKYMQGNLRHKIRRVSSE